MSDIRRVHEWFLARGLPLVLTRRVRSRALIERSAPVVSGIGALIEVTGRDAPGAPVITVPGCSGRLVFITRTGIARPIAGRRVEGWSTREPK